MCISRCQDDKTRGLGRQIDRQTDRGTEGQRDIQYSVPRVQSNSGDVESG